MKKLVFKTKKEKVLIDFEKIIYISILNKALLLVSLDGEETVLNHYSLQYLYKKIKPLGFVRCHKSFLVNIDYIKSFNKVSCTLQNGITIPRGRHYSKEFKELMDMIYG